MVFEKTNESRFSRGIKEVISDKSTSRLIFAGIVVDVDRYGGKWVKMGKPTPPYTLKAYIPEIDNNTDVDYMNFFEPFLPINLSAIPELKEEVLIFFDSPEQKVGYWIKRNDSNILTKTLPNLFMKNVSDDKRFGATITKNGTNFEFKETDDFPNEEKVIPLLRKKPGDVLFEGRSNTTIIHTFDLKNKEGVIDLVTERDFNVINTNKDVSQINQREFQDTKGTRIMLSTKFNVDKNEDWDLTNDPGFKYKDQKQNANISGDTNQHIDASYLYANSEEFRFVSRTSIEKLNNAVLGNNFEIYLNSFIDALQQLCNVISQTQVVMISGTPNDVNLMIGGANAVKVKLEKMKKTIYKFHSKNFYLN